MMTAANSDAHSSSVQWSEITAEELLAAAQEYPAYVSDEVGELENQRREVIPAVIRDRKAQAGAFINKDELMALVEWKSKQKASPYRAKLLKLAEANDAKAVKQASKTAFAQDDTDVSKAVQALTELRGIGPATASLALSCHNPDRLPFFSDPLFRWTHLTETMDGSSKGWDATIKYNVREYLSLCERINRMRQGFKKEGQDVAASQIEQAAYVIYHRRRASTEGPASGPGRSKRKLRGQQDGPVKVSKARPNRQ